MIQEHDGEIVGHGVGVVLRVFDLLPAGDGLSRRGGRQVVTIDDDVEGVAAHAVGGGEDGVGGEEGAAAELVRCGECHRVGVAAGSGLRGHSDDECIERVNIIPLQ